MVKSVCSDGHLLNPDISNTNVQVMTVFNDLVLDPQHSPPSSQLLINLLRIAIKKLP